MSRPERQDSGGADALRHPLRQALYILVRQRPATAKELEPAVRRPLKCVAYHLKVLVQHGYLEADMTYPGEPLYRLNPKSKVRLPLGEAGLGRVMALTFLDASWAALGESSQTLIEPVSETLALDAVGLLDASEVMRAALGELRRIADESKEREDGPPPHVIVAVASLIEHQKTDEHHG